MIWLQYDDPDDPVAEFGALSKHVYEDGDYPDALVHYEELKKDWLRTRILLEDNGNGDDWVVIRDDDRRWDR